MITLDKILKELKKYSVKICKVYPGVRDQELLDFENKIGYFLPLNFKAFLKRCNGFELVSEKIYGINHDNNLNIYQNYLWEKDESDNPIWPHLLPISPDGSGSHYCLDLKTITNDKKECNVIYWQHDYDFTEKDQPDIDTDTLIDFLWELLERIKESNDYDGSDK